MKNRLIFMLMVLLGLFSGRTNAQFVNGDLQDAPLALNGWTIIVDAQEYNTCQATTTNHWIDLTGSGWDNGKGVSQNVPTIPGKWYVLYFDLGTFSGHYFCDAGTDVTIAGVTTHYTHQNFASIPNRMEWRSFSQCFQATAAHTLISFVGNATTSSMSPPGYFRVGVIGLDNVSLGDREVKVDISAPCWNGDPIDLNIHNWSEVSTWAIPDSLYWVGPGGIFGNGQNSVSINAAGQYIVWVKGDCGWVSDTIDVEDCCDTCKPDVSWSNICYKYPATFNITAPAGCDKIMSDAYTINYGDGNTGNGTFSGASLTHTYAAGGSYTVTICWTACQVQKCTSFVVNISCECPCDAKADFTWIARCLDVDFTNTSTGGNILCQHWDFGDGSTSTDQNPSHSYASPGVYHVCLTVFSMGPNGCCCATVCKDIIVKRCGGDDPCADVVLDIAYQVEYETEGDRVIMGHVNANPVLTPSYPIVNTSWTVDGVPHPGGIIDLPPGTHIICVTVTFIMPDGTKCVKTVCITIIIPDRITPDASFTPHQERQPSGNEIPLGVNPNPTLGIFMLEKIPANTEFLDCQIIGADGVTYKLIHIQKPGVSVVINIENLPAGLYFLQVSGPGIQQRFKVIRQ